jgi:hypothetical protein
MEWYPAKKNMVMVTKTCPTPNDNIFRREKRCREKKDVAVTSFFYSSLKGCDTKHKKIEEVIKRQQ